MAYVETAVAILMVVLGVGLVIFIHEAGHFIMAKRNGVRVEIFSLGFGPAVWSFRRGETEYRLSRYPIGGYVRMTGEQPGGERSGEPFDLTSKTPWQRFQIFVAGAVMNILIAFPIAFLAFFVGKYETTSQVGVPGMSESYAGMLPGDVLLEVDGRRVHTIEQYRMEMIRRTNGTMVPVRIMRDGAEQVLQVEAMSSAYQTTNAPRLMIGVVKPDSPAHKAGLRSYDSVHSVNCVRVTSGDEVDQALRRSAGQKLSLEVRRYDSSGGFTTAVATLVPEALESWVIPDEDGLVECVVNEVVPGTPAAGRLKPEDVIERVEDGEGRVHPVPSFRDLKRVVEANPNRLLKIHVRGAAKPVEVRPARNSKGKGTLGITPKPTSRIAHLEPGSFHYEAGLRSGDLIVSVNGKTEGSLTWEGDEKRGLPPLSKGRQSKPFKIDLQVRRAGEPVAVTLEARKVVEGDAAKLGLEVRGGALALDIPKVFRKRTLEESVREGLYEPVRLTEMTFQILGKLVRAQESPKGLSGPIGIFHASFLFAKMHFGNFLWLLCLITVNLAIMNLLPIPLLDGGQNLLLLIEVIRKKFGKPPPGEQFIATFQYVGLVLVFGLLVLATSNDVRRLFFG